MKPEIEGRDKKKSTAEKMKKFERDVARWIESNENGTFLVTKEARFECAGR